MKREEFIFTVGFSGSTAIVDGAARRKYAGWSVDRLLEAGLFKQAVYAAVYDGDKPAIDRILAAYNEAAGTELRSRGDLERLFGVPLQVLPREGVKSTVKVEVV